MFWQYIERSVSGGCGGGGGGRTSRRKGKERKREGERVGRGWEAGAVVGDAAALEVWWRTGTGVIRWSG